jgi:hypothetical protein
MNNQTKNQDHDRKASMGADDNRNRDKDGSLHHQGTARHGGSGPSGSKKADGDHNRNPQR